VRYRVSEDGRRILETHRMHAGMMESNRGDARLVAKGGKALRDLPEDSDVFHVLVNRPTAAKVVVTPHHQYRIDVDGSIRLLQGKETVVGATR